MDVEAVACHIKKRFPELPIILLSAYCEMPARIPWLADDYIVKGETPERLVPILERVQRDGRHSHEVQRSGQAGV
jgi:two-component SAPR family response regulator